MIVHPPDPLRAACLAALVLAVGCFDGSTDLAETGGTDDPASTAPGETTGTAGAPTTGPGSDDDSSSGDTGDTGVDEDPCATPQAGHTPLRRLTREQYNNTVRDLFALDPEAPPADAFQPDERVGAFYINGVAPVAEVGVQDYLDAAEALAARVVAEQIDRVLPCDPQADGVDACSAEFIASAGRKLYRRPLTADEQARHAEVFAVGRTQGGNFKSGVELVLTAMLQSPHFLYLPEYGLPGEDVALRPLDGHELAARLSYFLWNTTPDDALMAAADDGALADAAGLRAQAERMLADDRASETIESFHLQWLAVDDLAEQDKDPEIYPAWTPKLARAMLKETARFADHVIREDDGSFATLMTSSETFAQGELLALLGGVVPDDHVDGEPIALDPARRHGILTHPSMMAHHAYAGQSSPIHRGVVVFSNVLCQELPPPPPEFMVMPPEVDLNLPTRERFEQHTADPSCAGCHMLIDGIGFGFEHYDGMGLYRLEDAGMPVDASGEIVGTVDKELVGPYPDAHAMLDAMVESPQVRGCIVRQWSRFALGRLEQQADMCSVEDLALGFDESGLDIRELLLTLVTTDMFRHRGADED